jgi:hypothetical protein
MTHGSRSTLTDSDASSGFHRTKFICVDGEAEVVPGTAGNNDGALLYHTRTAGCSNDIDLPCPPYDPEKELTCVVCSKYTNRAT